MKLGPVGEHQGHRLSGTQPKTGKPARERVHARLQGPPGDREFVAFGADRDLVGAL